MGMNYYFHPEKEEEFPLHIGKSSAGWYFALALHPNKDIMNLEEWIHYIITSEGTVRDEYGKVVTLEMLLLTIMGRKNENILSHSENWLERNHALQAENGLVRSRIDGKHCLAHGKGTYDYFLGDFS